jgi:HNH endonuclease
VFVRAPPFNETRLRAVVAESLCWSDVLRALGLRVAGGNPKTVKKYVALWDISTDHFDPDVGRRRAGVSRMRPLSEVLVPNSTYKRSTLKKRLYAEGIKERRCEMCGQGESWRGRRMSLILDHINGVHDDNRLENLRIVCPNCAATLDTHCGRNPVLLQQRSCPACACDFVPQYPQHRYCSRGCVGAANRKATAGVPRPDRRKVERPPYEQLEAEIAELGYSAVGRRYGVSGNAVRKWMRMYRAMAEQAAEK